MAGPKASSTLTYGLAETAYPAHREADVALRDGSTVHVRPVRPDDLDAIRAFLGGLSIESRAFRFFSAGANLDRAAQQAVEVDHVDRYGLIAISGHDTRGPEAPHVVGHGAYVRLDTTRAEAAFAVADDFQGYGLGTILLAHLAEAAHDAGIQIFVNQILPENHRMIDVFRESGFAVQSRSMPGYVEVDILTSLTEGAKERFWSRERTSAVAAMEAFLRPNAVALVGASRRGSITGAVFHNLLSMGFEGPVYPVNPGATVVQSVSSFASVGDIPGPVDLAVIVVPSADVLEAARSCGVKGVRALIVISSVFDETATGGLAAQRELLAVCRHYGMRLIGPDSIGVINTSPEVMLNTTPAPNAVAPGNVAFLSQSGALGVAVIQHASALGLGISSFVSVGNKADISGNDVIQYWEQDPATDAILLYLESFGNPRNFSRIARRVSRTKPIVAVKAGRRAAAAQPTSSRTGTLLATSDATVDALFRRSGVIRTDTLSEMLDVASLLANQPVPGDDRVGIVTNAGGLGTLCADACEAEGLAVPPLPQRVREALRGFLAPDASVTNPLAMIASATPDAFERAIALMAHGGGVDAIIVIFVGPGVSGSADVAAAIRRAADRIEGAEHPVPLITVFMSSERIGEAMRGRDEHPRRHAIPTFAYPEEAARALGHAARYGAWRARPEGTVPNLAGIDADRAAAIIAEGLRRGETWLVPEEVERLLECYGLPTAPSRVAHSARAAGRAAQELGGPVAVKAMAEGLVHRTDLGAIRLGCSGRGQAERAANEVRSAATAAGFAAERFLVQRMVTDGVEMLVGIAHDPMFGPVLAVGAGGTAVELTHDVAVRLTPLTTEDAGEMVRSLSMFPMLDGYRGAPKADLASLEDLILRVAAMVEEHAEIAEMDLDPVMVLQDAVVVVDARIRVCLPPAPTPLLARRNI